VHALANVSFSNRKRWADVTVKGPLLSSDTPMQVEYGWKVGHLKRHLARLVKVPVSQLRVVHHDAVRVKMSVCHLEAGARTYSTTLHEPPLSSLQELLRLRREHGGHVRAEQDLTQFNDRLLHCKNMHDGDELHVSTRPPGS